MNATSQKVRRSLADSRRTSLGFLLWGAGVLVVAGSLVAADRAWVTRSQVDPSDPAVRVVGAVRSISGSDSVRRSTYDPATRAARAEVTARYYDPGKPLQENREYLATEGRMAAQLALYDNRTVEEVTIALYARRTLLATVTARQGQAYEQMRVEYDGPLASK